MSGRCLGLAQNSGETVERATRRGPDKRTRSPKGGSGAGERHGSELTTKEQLVPSLFRL